MKTSKLVIELNKLIKKYGDMKHIIISVLLWIINMWVCAYFIYPMSTKEGWFVFPSYAMVAIIYVIFSTYVLCAVMSFVVNWAEDKKAK